MYATYSEDMETYPQNSTAVKPLYRGTQIIWYLFYVIEALLIFRIVLRMIGANPDAVFTQIIYTLSYPFAFPFLYVVDSTRVAGAVFEWTTLIALVVYWILAWGIVRLLVMGKPVSRTEAHVKLQQQDAT